MQTMFEKVGEERLHKMIDIFYSYVQKDPILLKIFPNHWDLTAYKQKLFQTQFLGGPNLYNAEFGHPMMRMRHSPFRITHVEKEAWLSHMEQAMDDVGLEDELKLPILARYKMVAESMVNTVANEEHE